MILTLLPKSKYYINNTIETIHIGKTRIDINCFYDKKHKDNRYSCTINYMTGKAIFGGYGKDNEIIYNTYEGILNYIIEMLSTSNESKCDIRDFKLKKLLNNE